MHLGIDINIIYRRYAGNNFPGSADNNSIQTLNLTMMKSGLDQPSLFKPKLTV